MADEKYAIEVTEKIAPSIEPKIIAIGKAATRSFDSLRQMQTMLNGIKPGGLAQLQSLLTQSANSSKVLAQAQTILAGSGNQSTLALQRIATEAQKTQIQIQNLATATTKTAQAQAKVTQIQAQSAQQAAQALANLTTAQTNAATAAQRLTTEQQRTAQAVAQTAAQAAAAAQRAAVVATQQLTAQQQLVTATVQTQTANTNLAAAQSKATAAATAATTATVNLTTAQTNATTAAQRLATEQHRTNQAQANATTATTNSATAVVKLGEAQTRAQKAIVDLSTANQRLATEQQRTIVQTQNAAAATDRARLAALQLAQAQQQLTVSSSNAANSLLTYAKAAAAAIGTAMGTQSVLKTADAYTTMQNKLVNVAVDQQSVNMLTGEMFSLSNRTGQSVEATTSAFQKFDTALMQMGRGQGETLRLIETLNKATVISGATTMEAASGILQLGQAFGSGRLQGDEFRAIMENLPVVADLIAKSMGKTRGELKALSSQGKITAEEIRIAFERAASDIDEKFNKTTFTLAQNFQILNNRFTQYIGELNKSIGLTSTLSGWIRTLGNNMDTVGVSLAAFSSLLLVAFGPSLISMLLTASKALAGFTLALATNPVGLLLVGIATATAYIATFGDEILIAGDGFITLKDYGRAALSFIVDGFNATTNFISSSWGAMIDFINDHTGGMAESFRDIFGLIANGAKMHANLIIATFVAAFTLIKKQWQTLPDLMKAVFANIVNYSATAVESLVNAWQISLRNIAKLASYVAPNMADSLNKALDSITLELPRMDVSTSVSDIAKDVTGAVADAFKKDYLGDAMKAFKDRALDMSVARLGSIPGEGSLRGESDIAKKAVTDPKAEKAAEKRAMALAKINGELNKQLTTMFTLNPQRAIDQQFDEIQIQLAGKKISLTDKETAAIKSKIAEINNNKQLQQSYDAIYEDSIKTSRDYNNTLKAANMLLANGSITSAQYKEAINKAAEAYLNATDNMRGFNDGIKDQIKILGKVGPAQDIERQVIQKRNELAARGIELTDTQEKSMRSQLSVTQKLTAANDVLNGFYDTSIGKQQQLAATGIAVADAHKLGYLSAEQYGIKLQQLAVDTANLKMQMGDATWADSFTASLGAITNGFDGVMSGVSRSFGDFFTSFTDGFANSVGQAVVTSNSLGDALHNVAQSAVAGLISSLVKLGIQYAINAALGTSINATALTAQTAASVAAAGITASAWAPAAALASLASFGANSVPAMAGITATTVLSEGIALSSLIPGYEAGGYTGDGGRSNVAGVVHGQEFVMNARATAQNRAVLEAMNAGRSVPGSVSTINNNTSGGYEINVSIINNTGEYSDVSVKQLSPQEIEIMIDKKVPAIMASETNNANSQFSKSMRGNYAMQRKS